MASRWRKIISAQGNLRGMAIEASELIQSLVDLHKLETWAAKGLGEALIGGLLVGTTVKNGERTNLNIQGDGRFIQALVDAYPDGRVRGYVIPRGDGTETDPPLGLTAGRGPWGDGLLSVLRTKDGESKQPYIGTVPLVTGHLAKDLTFFWAQSEQIPSSAGIEVRVEGNKIVGAYGFLVQAMPGATPEEIQQIEDKIKHFDSFEGELAPGSDPLQILTHIFQDAPFQLMEERELKFECNCSWERVERALSLVGMKEIESMIQDEGATVNCDFCARSYHVTPEKLRAMIAKQDA